MGTIKVFEVNNKGLFFLGCLDFANIYHLIRQLKDLGMKRYNLINGLEKVYISK